MARGGESEASKCKFHKPRGLFALRQKFFNDLLAELAQLAPPIRADVDSFRANCASAQGGVSETGL
jgi:hypothetical protein